MIFLYTVIFIFHYLILSETKCFTSENNNITDTLPYEIKKLPKYNPNKTEQIFTDEDKQKIYEKEIENLNKKERLAIKEFKRDIKNLKKHLRKKQEEYNSKKFNINLDFFNPLPFYTLENNEFLSFLKENDNKAQISLENLDNTDTLLNENKPEFPFSTLDDSGLFALLGGYVPGVLDLEYPNASKYFFD